VKSAGDRTLTMVAIQTAGLVLGLMALPFVDWPAPESWKWLALTAGVQFGYYVLLVRSYGAGDMSVVYPLARGLAPVLTTVVAAAAIGETLNAGQTAAVALISLIPITPGAVGLSEVAYVGLLTAVAGQDLTDQITAAVVIFRAAQWLAPIPIGWILLILMRRNRWREFGPRDERAVA